jgi:hypothetical protein
MKPKIWMLGLGMCLAAGSAFAAKKEEVALKAQDRAGFTAEVATVRKQIAGGRYEYMTSSERATLDSNLNDMQALFDKYDTADKMDGNDKARLQTELDATNALLAKRDNNRVVCERAAPMGSLIPKTTCRTYGDMERDRRDSQKFLQDTQQVNQQRGG